MPHRFAHLSLILALLVVAVSIFGIVSCERSIEELSVERLGPLVEVKGRLATLEEKHDTLEITLRDDERVFRCVSSYPEKFHLGSRVVQSLKAGQSVTLTVPQKELDELPNRKRWRWAEFVGLKSEQQIWLTPEGHIEWDRENQREGVRLLWLLGLGGLLWAVAVLFPSLAEPIAELVGRIFRSWITHKWWMAAAVLILMIVPTARDCWLDWRMRNAPLVQGVIVERENFKKYFLIPYHRVRIQPEGRETRISAEPRLDVPDEVEFRWDGQAKWIYLPQPEENPWRNLVLVTILGFTAAGFAILASKVLREE